MITGKTTSSKTEDDKPLHPRLAEILETTSEDETGILQSILTSGMDQGWFFRADIDVIPSFSAAELDEFFVELEERESAELKEDDPWAGKRPEPVEITGDDPGWIVITQRCDLVRPFAIEPLVEICKARLIVDSNAARAARLNSPRLIGFAPAAEKAFWAADLRVRATVSKSQLMQELGAVPAIDSDRRAKQFRLRVGQRYWRDPVPTDVVDEFQNPVRGLLTKSAANSSLVEGFDALYGLRGEHGRLIVIAIIRDGNTRENAEKSWEALVKLIGDKEPGALEMLDVEQSDVLTMYELAFGDWLEAFKFDFDEVTYGKKASEDQVEPSV